MNEDDNYVIYGPPPREPIQKTPLGRIIYDSFLNNLSDKNALVDRLTGEAVTFKQLFDQTVTLAVALNKCGYGKNSVIAVCSENSINFFTPIISAFYIGSTVTTFNVAYTSGELNHTVNISRPNVVFASKSAYRKFVELKKTLNFLERIIIIDSDESADDAECMGDYLMRVLRGQPVPKVLHTADLDVDTHVSFILSSSGTTGLPKGVMLTHTNIITRIHQDRDPRFHRYSSNSTALGILPFFHAFGLISTLCSLLRGQQVIVLRKFDEKIFLQTMEEYRINVLWIAPPIAVFLAKSPLVSEFDLTSLEEITCGAAPLSRQTEKAIRQRLPHIKIIRQGYGQTEGTIALLLMEYGCERAGSVGRVITYMKCKVRDPETGRSLPARQIGELCFKGPLLMKGYCGNPAATKETFTKDGWLRTGDLGYYDEDNYFFIVDRLKELIKYKGYQVAPAELEAVLLAHPKVREVGVVGLPDEEAGELPLAFVVKVPGVSVTEKELQEHVASKLSPQKRLRGGVIFVDAIPKNPSGKILRRELRSLLKKYKSKL